MWICLPLKSNQLEPKTLKASWKAILRLCVTVTGLRGNPGTDPQCDRSQLLRGPSWALMFLYLQEEFGLASQAKRAQQPLPSCAEPGALPLLPLSPWCHFSAPLFLCFVAQASCNMALHPGPRPKVSQRGRNALQQHNTKRGPCQLAPYPLPSLSLTHKEVNIWFKIKQSNLKHTLRRQTSVQCKQSIKLKRSICTRYQLLHFF